LKRPRLPSAKNGAPSTPSWRPDTWSLPPNTSSAPSTAFAEKFRRAMLNDDVRVHAPSPPSGSAGAHCTSLELTLLLTLSAMPPAT
jgi:hypothetical protein